MALPSTPVLVVMGVSGSGKSTIGSLLARRLDWDFQEGDALHPAANVAKMRAGHPLTDADREPWLAAVAAWITGQTDAARPGVITCSALRRRYRDRIRSEATVFVYLQGAAGAIEQRLVRRTGHFMNPALLPTQLDALEPPQPDEPSITVDTSRTPREQVDSVLRALGR